MSEPNFLNKEPKSGNAKDKACFILFFIIIMIFLCFAPFIESESNQELNDNSNSNSELPSIYIICSETINQNYTNCKFKLEYEGSSQNISSMDAKIRIRGRFSATLPKKGYSLELSEKISLLGMRKDDDWYLFAMYLDFTRMRYKLSFDLWNNLRNLNDQTPPLPESRYVKLYINNEFQGLYLFAEKVDMKLFGLDPNLNTLIFQSIRPNALDKYNSFDWEQKWPNPEDLMIIGEILPELIDFINNSADEEFFDPTFGIYSKFNKQNLIDFFLFNFFILHTDFWSKNYFLIRDTPPSKFRLIPWDFDGSFGQAGCVKYHPHKNMISAIKNINVLYRRLLNNEEFQGICKNRWKEIRETLWTEDFILSLLKDIHIEIKDILEIEMKMWKPITVDKEPTNRVEKLYLSTKEFDLQEYIDALYNWIGMRLEFCDSYFDFEL
ncbi:MAG: CotH kinase family protein [Promethearchaeota archaeon]